ncbi:ubiquinol oxidase subunit II [Gemmobacter serpentinus]|uniref:ubiquinol oxidase subunit II n=1 Tax=Gemmobacter serpentinus TaxID=2652247 RepID=UPI00124F7279|nr:ubiquinol oxidase subunit II [Gemmobacter serpentinus]
MQTLKRIAWVAPLLSLAACKAEVLAPTGDIAAQQRDMLVWATALMLIIIIPVMAMIVWFAFRYRASNRRAAYAPDWSHSTKLELVIWAIPLLIIVSLGALTWVGTHHLDPYRPIQRLSEGQALGDETPLVVQVVALDWKWLFIYPEEGVATVNDLVVPVDRPVEFRLTSSSVMNAFYIPSMAGMIYSMPGMETKLHGVFNTPGSYQGMSSHYSGAGFSGMRFKAHAVAAADYDQWVTETRAAGGQLGRAEYLELEKPSENVPPRTFAEVDGQLFARVVNMCVEDGKICMAEMMEIDRNGGTDLAGTMNVHALTYDREARRGAREPALGWAPFFVSGFCTPEDELLMLSTRKTASAQRDPAPLRGHALPMPGQSRSTASLPLLSLMPGRDAGKL